MDVQSTIAAEKFILQWKQTNQATLIRPVPQLPVQNASWNGAITAEPDMAFTMCPCKCMDQRGPGKFVYGVKRPPSSNFRNKWQKIAQLHEVQTKATTLHSGKADDRKESRKSCHWWAHLQQMDWAWCRQLTIFPAQPPPLQPQQLSKGLWAGVHAAGEGRENILERPTLLRKGCTATCTKELPTATFSDILSSHMQDRWTGRLTGSAKF